MAFLSDSLFSLPQDFQLEAQAVYTRAGEKLVRQRQYGAVRQLLKCVGESGTATKNDCDALILSYISVADKAPADVSDEIILKIQTHSCKHTFTSFFVLFFTIKAKELDSLILETKSMENKVRLGFLLQLEGCSESGLIHQTSLCLQIKAYLLCGKLRPAYLQAVKLEASRAGPLVQDVLQAAEGAQDSVMQNICRQWLAEHSGSSQQRQGRPSAR